MGARTARLLFDVLGFALQASNRGLRAQGLIAQAAPLPTQKARLLSRNSL